MIRIHALFALFVCAALVRHAVGAPKILSDKQLEQALTEGWRVLIVTVVRYHFLHNYI